jgi:hypothetical protein
MRQVPKIARYPVTQNAGVIIEAKTGGIWSGKNADSPLI